MINLDGQWERDIQREIDRYTREDKPSKEEKDND